MSAHSLQSKAFLPLLYAGKGKRVTYISSSVANVSKLGDVRTAKSMLYATFIAGGNLVVAKFAAKLLDKRFTFLTSGA